MNSRLYDGTSAYKIDEYNYYTQETKKKQTVQKKQKAVVRNVHFKKMALCVALIFAVAISFLYANVLLIQTASKASALSDKLSDMRERNTQTSFDIASGVSLSEVEEKAVNDYGMQHPESYQNVYVQVKQGEYAEVVDKKTDSKGIIGGIIADLKSFLSYIQ